jgi:hypothetical protein
MRKLTIICGLAILMTACNNSGNSTPAFFDPNKEEKLKITNQIENVYFGLANGAYTREGSSGMGPEGLPFYNTDFSTLIVMAFTPLGMLGGTFSIEPKNIEILNLADKTADVKYDLVITKSGNETIVPVLMTIKKIGGNWKLDGQKFLPLDENETNNQ